MHRAVKSEKQFSTTACAQAHSQNEDTRLKLKAAMEALVACIQRVQETDYAYLYSIEKTLREHNRYK